MDGCYRKYKNRRPVMYLEEKKKKEGKRDVYPVNRNNFLNKSE